MARKGRNLDEEAGKMNAPRIFQRVRSALRGGKEPLKSKGSFASPERLIGAMASIVMFVAFSLHFQSAIAAQRSVEITYRFEVHGIAQTAQRVAAWIPIPTSTTHQELLTYEVEGNLDHELVVDQENGNRFVRFDYLPFDKTGTIRLAAVFKVRRTSFNALSGGQKSNPEVRPDLTRYLSPDILVPIDGRIAEEASAVAGNASDPLVRARRLFDHIIESMEYDKSGKGWGRGDAVYACDIRTGNCTDFHSLFIAEARSLGIPARFVMGLPLPLGRYEGEIPGYHCWAEFYLDDRGWVPLDASEAHKFPEKKQSLWGGLDENRVQFTTGRDIKLPSSQAGPVNYSIYPHVEIDGKPYPHVTTRFAFRDVP